MNRRATIRTVLVCLGTAGVAGCATSGRPATSQKLSAVEHGYYKIGEPYVVDGVLYTPAEDWNYDETGIASWYGPDFHGKRTANGELYDMNQVTGAHKTLPMPSLVRVTNLDNGRSIIVRLNDRGPFSRGRILDLSRRGAQLLGYERIGTAKVHVQILAQESQALADAARQGRIVTDLAGLGPNARPPLPSAAAPVYSKAVPAYPPQAISQIIAGADEQTAIQQDVPHPTVKGSDIGGRFLPAPQLVAVQKVKSSNIYIQAGAFSVAENAERLRSTLNRVAKTDISPMTINGRALYRVRVGPIGSVNEADQLLARIVGVGANDAKIIVD